MPAQSEVILGENLEVLSGLPDAGFQMVYIDPPFNTGSTQTRRTV
jgi:site-specific DNA-methyltransferase (adenine-specific)